MCTFSVHTLHWYTQVLVNLFQSMFVYDIIAIYSNVALALKALSRATL